MVAGWSIRFFGGSHQRVTKTLLVVGRWLTAGFSVPNFIKAHKSYFGGGSITDFFVPHFIEAHNLIGGWSIADLLCVIS